MVLILVRPDSVWMDVTLSWGSIHSPKRNELCSNEFLLVELQVPKSESVPPPVQEIWV